MIIIAVSGLEPLMQASGLTFQQGIAIFFISGLLAMIIASMVVGWLWTRSRNKTNEEAEAAGVTLAFDSSRTIDVYGIEGCGYCIGLIIILVLLALGVTLPLEISENMENLIVLVIITVFGAASWAVTLWAPLYLRNERRRFRLLLEKAMEAEK